MIQETFTRLNGLVPKENILIVTNETQKPGIMEQLPEIPLRILLLNRLAETLQRVLVLHL